MRRAILALLATLIVTPLCAAQLSEDQATDAVVTYLRGDIYGNARMDILNAIRQRQVMAKGSTACGPVVAPVWAFHIHARYDGWLYLDAATGEKVCSSLPFFR